MLMRIAAAPRTPGAQLSRQKKGSPKAPYPRALCYTRQDNIAAVHSLALKLSNGRGHSCGNKITLTAANLATARGVALSASNEFGIRMLSAGRRRGATEASHDGGTS
jgi:hypothetical protein